jgi:hypothetical protein
MVDWFARARLEISKLSGLPTAKTDETGKIDGFGGFGSKLKAEFPKIEPDFGSFGSSLTTGFSKSSGAEVQAWRSAIEAILAPSNRDGERLLNASLAFLVCDSATLLLSCGWDAVALFGVHHGMGPRERLDAWGLVTTIAWSVLTLTIKDIAADHCRLTSRNAQGGSQLSFRRDKAGLTNAVPWWRHSAVIGGADA